MKRIIYILSVFLFVAACDKTDNTVAPMGTSDGNTGQGGSLARFTIANDHLYVVDNKKLYTYSLANSATPVLTNNQQISTDIETIYAYQDKLFIGSQEAMYIYSISDASHPVREGQASHVRACDPVVAKDKYAYVTVRSGTSCGGTISALMVYDITYISNPSLKKTINLEGPYGLGIKDNRLYVCNGSNGLNVYDISIPTNPQLVKKIQGDTFYDVIPTNDVLICMVQGGTVLYNYNPADELVKAAKISN